MYKITFDLDSPLLVHPFIPTLDGLLFGAFRRLADDGRKKEFNNLDNQKHSQYLYRDSFNIPFASSMFFDDSKAIEGLNFWVKRFDLEYDYAIDFESKVSKIDTGKKQYKNYKIPISELHAEQICFYLETGSIKKIKFLINEYLPAIGKKTSQGYGRIKKYKIENVNHDDLNFYDYVLRPYPKYYLKNMLSKEFYYPSKSANRPKKPKTPPLWVIKAKEGINEFKTEYRSWCSPYGDPANFDDCITPIKK